MIGLIHDLPKDKDGTPGYAQNGAHAQNGGGGILGKIILLTMPVLNLQLNVLGAIKKNIEGRRADGPGKDDSGNEGSIIKQLHSFVAVELHALCMILDRSGKVRSHIDLEHQKKLQAEIKVISDKVASGSVSLIEAQETVIKNIMDIMKKIKDEKPAPGSTSAN